MSRSMRRISFKKLLVPSFQYMKECKVVFDPLDPYATSAKEFLSRAYSPSLKKTNPTTTVTFHLEHDKLPSYIAITYQNNIQSFYTTHKRRLDEVWYDIVMNTGLLEYRYELDKDDVENEDEEDEMKP